MNRQAFVLLICTFFQPSSISLFASTTPSNRWSHAPYSCTQNPASLAANALYQQFRHTQNPQAGTAIELELTPPTSLPAIHPDEIITEHSAPPKFPFIRYFKRSCSLHTCPPSFFIDFCIANNNFKTRALLWKFYRTHCPSMSDEQRQCAIKKATDPELINNEPTLVKAWLMGCIQHAFHNSTYLRVTMLIDQDQKPLIINCQAPITHIFDTPKIEYSLDAATKTFTIKIPLCALK